MEDAGLPAPEYTDNAFMLNVTIRNGKLNGELNPALLYLNKSELAVYHLIEKSLQNSRQEIADQLNISTRTVDRAIKSLIQKDLIVREGSKKTGHWKIIK
ncbi:HTH domain-containing protein [Bacteroides heparinolyticus]|uniref:HTH domain-containing protein n=1 Tax=Prevotella heparinolytica TaxID=28113 RepID=UPI0035A07178